MPRTRHRTPYPKPSGVSACYCHRAPMPAQVIADLAGAERVAAAHVAEALQYRPRQINA